MLNNHRRGITGINLVVAAVIGLLILTVLVFMVGKNVGNFAAGKDNTRTCAAACSAGGADDFATISRDDCTGIIKGRQIGGQYSDVAGTDATGKPRICCCFDTTA